MKKYIPHFVMIALCLVTPYLYASTKGISKIEIPKESTIDYNIEDPTPSDGESLDRLGKKVDNKLDNSRSQMESILRKKKTS